MKKGKLIVIESGTDGSGKATQSELLYSRLNNEGYSVTKVSFPNYNSPSSTMIKMYLSGEFGEKAEDINPYVISSLFAEDRYFSFIKEWGDKYNNGEIIISDRYTISNLIHQASKLSEEEIKEYTDWLLDLEYIKYGIPKPDEVIFLNVLPTVSEQLMENRANKFTGEGVKDIHESNKEYLLKCYNESLKLANKHNWAIIDCCEDSKMRTIEDIHNDIYKSIMQTLSSENNL